jgi:hypothetical protein
LGGETSVTACTHQKTPIYAYLKMYLHERTDNAYKWETFI